MPDSIFARAAGMLLAAWLSASAGAATTGFTGTLSVGGPTMQLVTIDFSNHCVGLGSPQVLYKAYPFVVGTSGAHVFHGVGLDNGVYVYSGAFNPAAPLTNCFAADYSHPTDMSVNLPAGSYTLVVFDNSVGGTGATFAISITGPGSVTVTGPCSDFTDIIVANAFCASVQWMRNRSITAGCTATQYCPNDPVTRLQMAAFMNRLGNALEPAFVHQTQSGAHAVINADGVLCQTSAYNVTGFPRVATPSSVVLYHVAPAPLQVNARLVYSLDGGATWPSFGTFVSSATNVAALPASQSPAAGPLHLVPGQSVRFGVRANSVSASATDGGCELTVRLDSHTGTTSPFDVR